LSNSVLKFMKIECKCAVLSNTWAKLYPRSTLLLENPAVPHLLKVQCYVSFALQISHA
jgi:hypothetical protein